MVRRDLINKGRRYETFRRYGFTCQFCGKQPPEVVLVETESMLAACPSCANAEVLEDLRPVRSDRTSDHEIGYLETQQEIAEMRRYRDAISERDTVIEESVEWLIDVWSKQSGRDWPRGPELIRHMVNDCGLDATEEALRAVASKVAGGYLSTSDDGWIGYLWTVARSRKRIRG